MTIADSLEDVGRSDITNKVFAHIFHGETHNIINHEKPYKH
jgi:hypothetical protein